MRGDISWQQCDSRVVGADSLIEAPQLLQQRAARVVRFSVVGRELQGVVEMDEGGVALPEFAQQACAVQVRIEVGGPQRNDLLVAGDRLGRSMQCTQHRRAITVGFDEVWPQRQGLIVARQGRLKLPVSLQRNAAIGMEVGIVSVKRERAVDQGHRLIVTPGLAGNDAEQM